MPKVGIKKDDEVQVISGKDRGRRGRVVHVLPREGRIMVEGVGRATKHARTTGKRSKAGSRLQQGGIIQTEMFIDLSNVQLVCKSCGKPTRIGHQVDGDVKSRVCRRCGSET
jgi:large subunit ribosomal protein L24